MRCFLRSQASSSTFWNPDHECISLLTTTSSFRVGAFRQRPPSLRHFHHEPVEMLTFGRSVTPDTWLTKISIVSAFGFQD